MTLQETGEAGGMKPLWLAPDLIPLTEAHEYLPFCRSTVYELHHQGKLRAEALPRQLFVTKTEILRLLGRSPEPEPQEQTVIPGRRERRPRPIAGRMAPVQMGGS